MTTDVREQILARIRVIIGGIPGVAAAARNRIEISGTSRPAMVLHDGEEEAFEVESPAIPPRGSQLDFFHLQPRIQILAGAPTESVGPLLSGLRLLLIPAILNDATLLTLVGGPAGIRGQGQMRYLAATVETVSGQTNEATMELTFRFDYVFRLSDLTS